MTWPVAPVFAPVAVGYAPVAAVYGLVLFESVAVAVAVDVVRYNQSAVVVVVDRFEVGCLAAWGKREIGKVLTKFCN